MITDPPAVVFSATGKIETYVVPVTGGYIIEAAGAETVIAGGPASVRGDRIKGMFYLNRGDILKILVGNRDAGGSHPDRPSEVSPGGSIVWRGAGDLFLPAQLMLAAAGGGWALAEADAGAVREGVLGSFNAGAFQVNSRWLHTGDGHVSIVPVTAPVACGTKDELARFARRDGSGDPERAAAPEGSGHASIRARAFSRGPAAAPSADATAGRPGPWVASTHGSGISAQSAR